MDRIGEIAEQNADLSRRLSAVEARPVAAVPTANLAALRNDVSEVGTALDLVRESLGKMQRRLTDDANGTAASDASQEQERAAISSDGYPTVLNPQTVQQYVEERHLGKLVLHKRAMQSLKKSQFEGPSLVYRVLDLLANDYRDMQMNSACASGSQSQRRNWASTASTTRSNTTTPCASCNTRSARNRKPRIRSARYASTSSGTHAKRRSSSGICHITYGIA